MKKKLLLSLVFVAFTSFLATAQSQGRERIPVEERAKKVTEKMAQELELSDDQKAEVLKANMELMEKRRAAGKKGHEAGKEHDARMKEILSEEQYEKFQKEREKRKLRKDDRPMKRTKQE